MGRGVLDVGDSPQLGSVMKLVGNFYIMSMMELIGEGLTLADKTGLNREAVVKFLKESFQGPITGGKTSYFLCTTAVSCEVWPCSLQTITTIIRNFLLR